MSETASSRHIFAPYCKGLGIDMGFGFDLVVPTAMGMDLPQPYTRVGGDKQTLRGSCKDLSGFCDESLDYIHSSHLCEDFSYHELSQKIIPEWRRVLKVGGYLLTNCPDQQKYLEVNRRNGTMDSVNQAHLEQDFSLEKWNHHVVANTGPWETVFEEPNHGEYSWLQVLRKI